MRAAVCPRYGPPEVIELRDLPKPRPAADELLIRVHATTVSSADWRLRSLTTPRGFGPLVRLAFGLSRPRKPVLGSELAGVVEAVGAAVTAFRPGDRVIAFDGMGLGCHAEYRCLPAHGPVAPMPSNLDFTKAATLCFGGCTMLDFFRRAPLRPGERVLVNGASGTVGSAAVQLAVLAGAEVTGVCSQANGELVRSLGATHVIDHHSQDFARMGVRYDLIVETVGNAPYERVAPALAPAGRLLLVLAELKQLLMAPVQNAFRDHTVIAGPAAEKPEYVTRMSALAAGGQFKPVIDQILPFARIVDAHRRVESGRKRGSVVVTLTGGSE